MDVFDLVAKITLDNSEFNKELDNTSKESEKSGDKSGNAFAKGFKKVIAALAGAAVIKKSFDAITGLVKQSIGAYADYEQLVGGVETLFGAGGKSLAEYAKATGQTMEEAVAGHKALLAAQNEVMRNASNAYKTAGMSANEYMETVTSFSASLIQSLGGDTKAAASYADMAITDMSDNANKMGTDMEAIQSAYQGFAKQNYTMLDNLKLGYGGTKTEMERLILDAEKLDTNFKATRDSNGDLAMSYADIVDAIHIVQTDMGITGTTAKEASETISGSLGSMKAAWANLVVGVADDSQDFGKLMDNFVDSAKTAASNILPRITTALSGIGNLVTGLAPVITEAITELVNGGVLTTLLSSAATLISTLASALIENLPAIFDVGLELLMSLSDGLIKNLPAIFGTITRIITTIVTKLSDPSTISTMAVAAMNILLALAKGIISNIPQIIALAPQIIIGLVDGLVAAWPEISAAGVELLATLIEGIDSALSSLLSAAGSIINKIKDGITAGWDKLKNVGQDMIDAILQGLKDAWEGVKTWFSNAVGNLRGKASVEVEGTTSGGAGHAIGMDYVPYNGYPATLHRGEAVLTASEADEWRRGFVPAVSRDNDAVDQIVVLLETIIDNGLNANISSRQLYKSVTHDNLVRTKATGYNLLAAR